MKNYIFFLLGLILFLHTACENTNNEDKLFPMKKNVVFTKMNVKENIGKINLMKCVNNYIVITGKNLDFQTQCQLIDKETKDSYYFGITGDGPGRLMQSVSIMPLSDKQIGIYDLGKRSLFSFSIDSIIRNGSAYQPEVRFNIIDFTPLNIGYLDNNTYIATGVSNEVKRFMILDGNGKIHSMEGELPPKIQEKTSNILHSYAYWGQLTTNTKKRRIAICTNYAGIIQTYDLTKNEVQLIKEHNLFYADYDDNGGNLGINARTRWGYLSIDSNDKYIFVLYSGMNQMGNEHNGAFSRSNRIHIFDWNGNPVCLIISNIKLQKICVDNKHLYGYSDEIEDIVIASIKDMVTTQEF